MNFLLLVLCGVNLINYSYKLKNSSNNSIYDESSKTAISFVFTPTSYNHIFKIEEKEPYKIKMYIDTLIFSETETKEIKIKKLCLLKETETIDLLQINGLCSKEELTYSENSISIRLDELPIKSKIDKQFIIQVMIEIIDTQDNIYVYNEEFLFIQIINKEKYYPSS